MAELVQHEIGVVAFERILAFQEERQGRGGEQVAILAEHLGAFQDVAQHILCTQHGLVHIHLPIHDAACHDETLHGIDALGFNGQVVVDHFHHLQQTLCVHTALGHTGEETVALQIIDSVDIQLAGNEFGKKAFFIFSFEHLDGHVKSPVMDFVELLHHHQREFLMRNALHDAVFQGV